MQHEFDLCLGDSLDDAWFLARRFETRLGARGEQADPARTEHWVGRVKDGKIEHLWGTRTMLSALVGGPGGAYTISNRYPSGGLREENGLWRFGDDGIEPFKLPRTGFSTRGLLTLAD